ncbi:MAG: ATP synthase F1 subunit delta [bacterium]
MKEEIIGKRYAKALIRLGQDSGTWRQIGQDLDRFASVFEENEVLNRVLCDPVHERSKRKVILGQILDRMGIEGTSRRFVSLLLDKERIRYLPAIRAAYMRLEDGLAGRLRARVYAAARLSDEEIAAIQTGLGNRFKKQIVLETHEDPMILGGIVCKVDGMVFDGSVKTQLEKLRETIRGE